MLTFEKILQMIRQTKADLQRFHRSIQSTQMLVPQIPLFASFAYNIYTYYLEYYIPISYLDFLESGLGGLLSLISRDVAPSKLLDRKLFESTKFVR